MTDRFNGLLVVLDRDIREDDAQPLIDALMQMKGVVSVSGNVSDLDNYISEQRIKRKMLDKIFCLIRDWKE